MLRHLKKSYEQAGVKACLLTFYQPDAVYAYTTAELDTITAANLSFQEGLSALVESQSGDTFSETQTMPLAGELYLQSITLSTAGLSAAKRSLLHKLSKQRVHVLVQDMRGNWWLYGQQRGLRLSFKADSGYSITLSGVEKKPASQVSSALIPGFLNFL